MVRRAKLLALACLTSFGVVSLSSVQTQVLAQSSTKASHPVLGFQAEADVLAQSPSTSPTPGDSSQTSNPVLLSPGSKSSDVMILQQQLQRLGYYKGPIDGSYGPGTQRAVRGFQQQAALPATGRLDQLTWQQMQTPQLFSNDSLAPSTTPSPKTPTPTSPNPAALTAPTAQPIPAEVGVTPGEPTASTPISAPAAIETADPTPTQNEGRLLWDAIALLSLLLVLASTVLLALFVWKRLQQRPRDPRFMPLGSPSGTGSPLEVETDFFSGDSNTTGGQVSGQSGALNNHWAASSNRLTEAALVPLDVEETTRLSRVNITDELVTDLASQDSNQRHKTIWELGQRGNSTAIQPLVEAMIDADSKERSLILAALSEIGMRTLKPMNRALALSLQDENPEVRKNAIRDLTRVYDQISQISQMLGRAIQDNDPEVQETAQWALDQLGRIRSLPNPSLSGTDPSESSPQLPDDSSRFRS